MYGTMAFSTSCFMSMSEEAIIKLSKVYCRILCALLELEIVKRDLFNTVEVCVEAAFKSSAL